MTSTQLKAARASLKLTQKAFAKELEITKSAVEKLERGIHPISGPMAMAVNCLVNHGSDYKKYSIEITPGLLDIPYHGGEE